MPLPLPASAGPAGPAVPDGGPAWSGEHARRWLGALPPRWVPQPSGNGHLLTAWCATVAVTALLASPAGWQPWAAALSALHVLWLCARPEIVPVSAPVAAVLLLALRPGTSGPGTGGPATAAAVAGLALVWGAAVLRLVARRRQRERAREAAGGTTAPLPDAEGPQPRGRFLTGSGTVLLALGAGAVALTPAGAAPAGRTLAWLVAGQGLTTLLSGLLGRRRAAALRAAPAPVLRVLVREGADGDTEVFAADDPAGLRPLFRVAVTEAGGGVGTADGDEEETQALLARLDREGPGPLREAVLHGAPCDGAEVLLVTAAEEAGRPPVCERSSGPVRPLSDASVRRALAREERRTARRTAYAELRRSAGDAVASGAVPAGVRQWRAGPLDRLCALLLVFWAGSLFWSETGGWRYALGAVAGFVGALWLPHWLAWRITADREGLWFNGLRGPRHLPWDEIRTVECKGTELTVDSLRASFTAWSAHAPRWPWLERRFRLVHPHERVAGEITALWRTPALRPSESAGEGQRGRPLWPLALVLEAAWAAALVFAA
ncbi:hypothetical protein GCM10010501_38050 [Streptomyces libani subsp. rufus]|nr:hypothetical protein GCM10010501_38050 [Streptomyces libani subsp. rufus]